MSNRTTGIITTSVAAVLCGCPGLLMLCFGAVTSLASFMPGAEFDLPTDNNPRPAFAFGLGTLCLGLIMIAIPILVGAISLRNRPEMVITPGEPPGEPIPPAS
jgi:hypothetical protein